MKYIVLFVSSPTRRTYNVVMEGKVVAEAYIAGGRPLNSVQQLMKTISDFKVYSGFGVNKDKTELMPQGCSNKDDQSLIKLG